MQSHHILALDIVSLDDGFLDVGVGGGALSLGLGGRAWFLALGYDVGHEVELDRKTVHALLDLPGSGHRQIKKCISAAW